MMLQTLFNMQKKLDAFIERTQQIDRNVFQEKGLALLVELAELANETRCFKFWSTKGPSERPIILEEFVDSIHFMLSLGLEKGFDDVNEWPVEDKKGTLTEVFLHTQQAILQFIDNPTRETYQTVWQCYAAIAHHLDFTFDDIVIAYVKKNEENHNRQLNGY